MGKVGVSIKHIVAAVKVLLLAASPLQAEQSPLDVLYEELAAATVDDAPLLEKQIIAQWEQSGSAALDLLLRRGKDALESGQTEAAIDHFSAAIDHAPAFAEAYYGRASAFYAVGELGPALEDLRQVLLREPRHFEALRGLAVLMEEMQRPQDALALYRMVLDINPHVQMAAEAVARLEEQTEGQPL